MNHHAAIAREPDAGAVSARTLAVSVVIPAKDEEESLPLIVARIVEACAAAGVRLRDIVLVDDGSRDGSWRVMTELAAENGIVQAIRLRRNFGKATALMVGIGACAGDVVITMDADLQDDPDEIPRFLDALDAGYDVVSGWKKERHDPLSKTLPSRLFNRVDRRHQRHPAARLQLRLQGLPARDLRHGRSLRRAAPLRAGAGRRARLPVGEIAVRHHARRYGQSKYGVARFLNGFLDLLDRGDDHPLRLPSGAPLRRHRRAVPARRRKRSRISDRPEAADRASIGSRPLLLLGALAVIIGIQLILFGGLRR